MPIGITYEQVAQAADELLQEGKYPSNATIRERLGGTGSFSTISKYLAQWRSSRLLHKQEDILLPENANDPVSHAVKHVWTELEKKSQAKIDEIQQAAHTQLQQYREELENTQQAKEEALQHVHTLTDERRQLLAENHGLQQQLQQLEREHLKLTTQFHEVQQFHTQEKEHYEKQAETLTQVYENNVADLKAQVQHFEKMLSDAKDYQETYRQKTSVEIENLKVRAQQLELRNTTLQKEEEQAQTLLKQLQQEKQHYSLLENKIDHCLQQFIEKDKIAHNTLTAFQQQWQNEMKQSYQSMLKEIQSSFTNQKEHDNKSLQYITQLQHTIIQQLSQIAEQLNKAPHYQSDGHNV